MVKVYLNLGIFTVFLKNRNFISKIKRSKVTDYAALKFCLVVENFWHLLITFANNLDNKNKGPDLFDTRV